MAFERAGSDGEAYGPRNHRNGHSRRTVLTGTGTLELQVPRDRLSGFEAQLVAKHRRCFPEFDGTMISLYAGGMAGREIQGHVRELDGIDASPDQFEHLAVPTPLEKT